MVSRILPPFVARLPRHLMPFASSSCRALSSSTRLCHGDYEWEAPKSPADIVNITYIDRDNIEHDIEGKIGDNVLFLAHRHDIDIEGACEAALVSRPRSLI